ncbi:MAG: hypothetical protein QGH37_20505 [Candidatus Poribacteria bacterium]|nr:hypothetical protein [Candidatus Poribacteria bacterium]
MAQQKEILLFGIESSASRKTQLFEVGKLTGSRPQYLVVNCADNATKSYVDSRWMPSHDTVRPVFSTWTESQLTFGQTSDGSSNWAGSFVANHRFSCRSECIRS